MPWPTWSICSRLLRILQVRGGSWYWREPRLLLSQVAMVILPFSLEKGRADLLSSRKCAMATSTALYYGKEEDGHGHVAFHLLEVEGQTTSHCKVRRDDQAMAPASDEDILAGSFKCTPLQNRADLIFSRRSSMITSTALY